MKKKTKRLLDWFYQESDRGEQNIAECKNLYELVEKLQYRLEDLENEHMMLLKQLARIQSQMESLD